MQDAIPLTQRASNRTHTHTVLMANFPVNLHCPVAPFIAVT